MVDTLFFYIFAALVLGGGVLTVTRPNAVHSALWLIVTLLGTAGLFLLRGAEFLFAVQIVLYIGGVVLLILFVVMLVNLDATAKLRQFNKQWWVAGRGRPGGRGALCAQTGMGTSTGPACGAARPSKEYGTGGRRPVLGVPAAVRNCIVAAGSHHRLRRDGQEEDLKMHPITDVHFLVLSTALLLIGTVGVLTRRNIVIRCSIELMLNAVNINLVAFSHRFGDVHGQVFAIFIIAVAAAETAVALGILIALFRNKETVLADEVDLLKW
jgi:NADH:ubiquinone oxidoreductase subunit K